MFKYAEDTKFELLTYLTWTKWPPFCRRHLQMHFLEWKVWYIWFKFLCSLFPRVHLTIIYHWLWLNAEQAACHYMNQCWPSSPTHICDTMGSWVNCLDVKDSDGKSHDTFYMYNEYHDIAYFFFLCCWKDKSPVVLRLPFQALISSHDKHLLSM